jgi:hypothetical protein
MLEGTKRKRTFMGKTDPPSIMQMTHCTLESDWHPKAGKMERGDEGG